MDKKLISLIIPMHNEEGNVRFVFEEAKAILEEIRSEKGYEYELIFVNDGSQDKTLEILKSLKRTEERIRILNMDRNRGEASALSAGFYYACGQYIFTMDGDGQNDPRYIKDLLEKLEGGYKVATGFRIKRKEPFFSRRLPSFLANRIIGFVTGLKVRDNGCSLKGYVAEIPKRRQIPHGFHRFLPAFFEVTNEEVVEIPVLDRKRYWGKSHYGLKRTFEVLRELITFPFLKKSLYYEKFFKALSYGHIILALSIGLWLIFSPNWWKILLILALSLGAGLSRVIYKNLNRYNLAQREGVFQVEEL
ncbi:MAG: glycosyltransferase family 2 protein [Caldimicrobium sp.]|nr:glycosyltransferase family 2 protein [Caldimicrobium sp.]MDW8094442.1 glycosyltransferase family 2 protein [Caldimicrobium sp.]